MVELYQCIFSQLISTALWYLFFTLPFFLPSTFHFLHSHTHRVDTACVCVCVCMVNASFYPFFVKPKSAIIRMASLFRSNTKYALFSIGGMVKIHNFHDERRGASVQFPLPFYHQSLSRFNNKRLEKKSAILREWPKFSPLVLLLGRNTAVSVSFISLFESNQQQKRVQKISPTYFFVVIR